MKKRILSVLLVLVFVLALAPTAFAEGEGKEAKIGITEYMTLEAAINAASEGDTITLLSNITINTPLSITKTVTIDGTNDYGIYASSNFIGGSTAATNAVILANTGTVTLKDVTIDANSKCRVVYINSGKLIIDGAIITGGATASSYIGGVYVTNKASFEMKSGSITGNSVSDSLKNDKYLQYSADLWIGANAEGLVAAIENGTVGNIFVNSNEYSANDPGIFTMSGGTVENIYVEYDEGYGGMFKYEGGTIENLYISTTTNGIGKKVTPIVGTTYKGGVINVAKIGDTGYTTLEAAILAATADETIELLDDIYLTEKITIDKSVTIDGNDEYTINGTADLKTCFVITAGNVTIQNMTIQNFGANIYGSSGSIVIWVPTTADSNTNLTVDNVILNGFSRTGIAVNSGTFNINNCEIDCSNTAGRALTKAVMVGYGPNTAKGIINNCSIYNSTSTISNWTSSAIEVYLNGEVNITSCEITDSNIGVWVEAFWPVAGATGATESKATISDTTIVATYPVVVYHSEPSEGFKFDSDIAGKLGATNAKATAIIESGNYSGELALCDNDESGSSLIIKGGYFTRNPSAYVVSGKVAISEKNTIGDITHNYTVVDAPVVLEGAEVAAKTGESDVTINSSISLTEDVQKEIANAVEASGLAMAALSDTSILNNNNVTVAKTTLETAGITINGEDITLVVEPYLEIEITGYDANSNTITLDITALYNLYATIGDPENMNFDGADADSVQIDSAGTLDTTDMPITITITLPEGLNLDFSDGVYIEHVKSDGTTYYYPSTYDETTETITFTVTNGFSYFTLIPGSIPDSAAPSVYVRPKRVEAVKGESVRLNATVSSYSGTISYQWYVNDKDRDYGGDAIRGATEDRYYPETSSVGTDYYYVVVTNIVNGNTLTATSNVVEVTVSKSDSSKGTIYAPSGTGSALSLYAYDSGSSTGITPVQFSDTGSHWASYYIENVAAKGWIIGYPDGTFKPNGSITRAELIMIVYRLTGGATFTGASESGYSDVGSDDWYASAVNYCVANGYLYGVFDGDSLLPNQAITRGEVAAILAKLKGYYSSSNGQSSFNDVNADDNFAGAIEYLAGLELINGYPDGTYRPNSSITRAEICTILFKGWIA